MNKGRKLDLAIQKTAEISRNVFDLRVILAKMSERQKALYTYMVRGYDELQTFVLAKRISEIAGVIPSVTTESGYFIKTRSLKTLSALKKLSPDGYQALLKIARDHIYQSIGNANYGKHLSDLDFFFRMIAPEAAKTVTDIMMDKKVAPQTRLNAANNLLDRGGYHATENKINVGLPYYIKIQVPEGYGQKQQEETIEAERDEL